MKKMMTVPVLFLLSLSALAQDGGFFDDPGGGSDQADAAVDASFDREVYRPGDEGVLTVHFSFDPPWTLYGPEEKTGIPTKVTPPAVTGVEWGKPELPESKRKEVPSVGTQFIFPKPFDIRIPFKVTDGAGETTVRLEVDYQLCSNEICLFPQQGIPVEVNLLREGGATAAAPSGILSTPAGEIKEEAGGLAGFLLAAVGGGLITLLMPCVFPLIPITISYFVRQAEQGQSRGWVLSGTYAAGIVASFTAIGVIMSLWIGPDGARKFAANYLVNIGVGTLFLVFMLSMFGLFKLRLPASWTSKVTAKQRQGLGGAFVLGMLFSIVTFTCTVPIAGSILALAAEGEQTWALFGMLAYSGTMALPFLLMGFFPALLKKMPRSGGWLETVEHTVGFVEFGLASFYFSKADQVLGWGILDRQVMALLYIAVCVLVVFYLYHRLLSGRGQGKPVSKSRLVLHGAGMAFFAWLVVSLVPAYYGHPSWLGAILPADNVHAGSYDQAVAKAEEEGKPIFLEFTGLTCSNCRQMEETVLSRPSVKALLENYVVGVLWTDKQSAGEREISEQNQKLMTGRFRMYALPAYILLSPDGETELGRLGGMQSLEDFEAFLKSGLE